MRPFRYTRYTWLALAAFVLVSCAGFQGHAPQGFAPYSQGKGFRAVSPDGVVYRVQSSRLSSEADLAFWREALNSRMKQAGYHLVDSLNLEVDHTPAYALWMEAPLGSVDQSYMVVAIPKGKKLVVVEAAGDTPLFTARKQAILDAVKQVEIR